MRNSVGRDIVVECINWKSTTYGYALTKSNRSHRRQCARATHDIIALTVILRLRTLAPSRLRTLALLLVLLLPSCAGVLKREYEYEEELYVRLDGSATVNVNASVAALVALRGADLPLDSSARLDRQLVRDFFSGPGAKVSRVSLARRDGRRFVHVGIEVANVRQLSSLRPFAWSTYRFDRQGDVFEFRQMIGKSAAKDVGDVGWTGAEIVSVRLHIPSEIPFHNAPSRQVQRGNIVEWQQPLTDRLKGEPLEVRVQMEPESILYTTLILFGATVVAAALTFALAIWLVMRKGRQAEA